LARMKLASAKGMKHAAALVLSTAVLAASALKTHNDHPLKNIIVLIQNLDAKVDQSSKAEKQTFAKYEAWAGKTTSSLKRSLQDQQSKTSEMGLEAEAKQKNSEVLAHEIQKISTEVAQLHASAQSAAESRQEAEELHNKTMADLNGTIDAVEIAFNALKSKAPATKTTPASLLGLPLVLERISEAQEVLLLRTAEKAAQDPQDAAVYESKSGSVEELLSQLLRDFQDKRADAQVAEVQAANEYNLAKTARENALTTALASKEKKQQAKADSDVIFVSLTAALKSTNEEMATGMDRLQEIDTDTKLKTDEFKEREEMRLKERKALAEGISILQQVTGVRTVAPSTASMGLVQFRGVVQIPSAGQLGVLEKRRLAAAKLRSQALLSKSKDLEELADKFEAHLDSAPVDKQIDRVLEEHIWKLKDDQLRDDKDKAWCDLEISKTSAEMKNKGNEVLSLQERITSAKADVVALIGDIQAAKTESAEVKQEIHEATLLREEAKHENQLAIEDSQDAQRAIAKAISTLQDYYKTASLLQQGQAREASATWDQSYAAASGSSSVITVLEESSAKFGRMEVDTKAQEAADQAQFDTQKKEGRMQLAHLETEVELKEQEKSRLTEKVHSYSTSWKLSDRQHSSEMNYLKTVEDKCDCATSYAERKAARDKELQTLTKTRAEVAEVFGNWPAETSKPTASFLARVSHSLH